MEVNCNKNRCNACPLDTISNIRQLDIAQTVLSMSIQWLEGLEPGNITDPELREMLEDEASIRVFTASRLLPETIDVTVEAVRQSAEGNCYRSPILQPTIPI